MKLITKAMEKSIPALYSTSEIPANDTVMHAKLFLPGTACTWFIAELDMDEGLIYGWATLGLGPDCDEWGYTSLEELESLRSPLGLPVERDMYFTPKPFMALKKGTDY